MDLHLHLGNNHEGYKWFNIHNLNNRIIIMKGTNGLVYTTGTTKSDDRSLGGWH